MNFSTFAHPGMAHPGMAHPGVFRIVVIAIEPNLGETGPNQNAQCLKMPSERLCWGLEKF